MFTGIVQGMARVVAINKTPAGIDLILELPVGFTQGLEIGASIAIEGACLTVVAIDGDQIKLQVIFETLELTMLDQLQLNQLVNFERSLKFGDEVGGHLVSGHVHGVAQLNQLDTADGKRIFTFELPGQWMQYVFAKGYIALAGCSLTITDVNQTTNSISVHLIPETYTKTTFNKLKLNDYINFEVDQTTRTIVDTTQNYLKSEK